MNHKLDKNTPHFDVQLLFDQIGVALDDNQYRDAISLADMYHVYIRQHQVKNILNWALLILKLCSQYRKLRPSDEEFKANRGRALLRFAAQAILDGVHDRRRKWTWAYFAERRDDRNKYVELFEKKMTNSLRESVCFVLLRSMTRTIILFRTLRCSMRWNASCRTRTSASTGRSHVPVYEKTWS